MRKALFAALVAALALSGCAARYSVQSGSAGGAQTTTTGAQVNIASGSALGAAIVVGVVLADGMHYYRLGPDGKTPLGRAPEPDPTRRINLQDCTRPIDLEAGNLMCR